MKPHETFLQLAAIAIDFPLAAAERRLLDQHLADCAACARTAAMLRRDAVALTYLPHVTLPERRAAEIIAAALNPAPVRVTGRLLLIAAMLSMLLMGSLVVGAGLLRLMQSDDDDLSVVVPVPSLSASPPASPLASPPGVVDVTAWDGNLVVATTVDGTEWIELLAADGSTVRLAQGREPAWLSPGTVVYTCTAASGTRLDVCAVDLATPMQPRTLVQDADRPVPAPDGRTIAVHRGMIDVGETWLVDADGTNARLLSTGAFSAWSPDGAWLAGQPESAALEVAMVGSDGQGYRVLGPGRDPAWNASGTRLTYVVTNDSGSSIVSMGVSQGDTETLVEVPASSWLRSPVWLDVTRLMFVQDGDIRIFGAPETYEPVAVTSGAGIDFETLANPPAVVSDGTVAAYTAGTGTGAHVVVTPLDPGEDLADVPVTGATSQPRWGPSSATGEPAVATAPPGYTWSPAILPSPVGRPVGVVEAVTAGGPGFVAVGRGCVGEEQCEGVVWTTTDGSSWLRTAASDALNTGAYFPTSGPEIGMFDVAAGSPGLVAIGYAARPSMQATAWFSPDGVTWERLPLGAVDKLRVYAVGWDGRRFIIVGEDRSTWDGTLAGMDKATARAAVWTSTDGRSFDRVPHSESLDVGEFVDTMEDPSTGGMLDVVAGPAGLVAVGSVCTAEPRGCEPMAWTSADGTAWERATGLPELSGSLRAVAASDVGYVAVGTGAAVVLTSPDGQTWTPVPAFGTDDLDSVTRVGDRFIATSSVGPETVWASPDGTSWAPLGADGGPSTSDEFATSGFWQFGADDVTAVWLGRPEAGDPAAWVSVGQAAR